MTTLHSLLAECECWIGVEPLGDDQWLEVAELRERVLRAIGASTGKRDCRECRGVGSTFTETTPGMAAFLPCKACASSLASEKEPLPQAAASFLADVAVKRGLDGLE
jgi:hypothetical protein